MEDQRTKEILWVSVIGLIVIVLAINYRSDHKKVTASVVENKVSSFPNTSGASELEYYDGIQSDQACYDARQVILKYIKNPLEAEISDECSYAKYIVEKGWWSIAGTGMTKNDFGVKKKFNYTISMVYSISTGKWTILSHSVVAANL